MQLIYGVKDGKPFPWTGTIAPYVLFWTDMPDGSYAEMAVFKTGNDTDVTTWTMERHTAFLPSALKALGTPEGMYCTIFVVESDTDEIDPGKTFENEDFIMPCEEGHRHTRADQERLMGQLSGHGRAESAVQIDGGSDKGKKLLKALREAGMTVPDNADGKIIGIEHRHTEVAPVSVVDGKTIDLSHLDDKDYLR